MSQQINLFNPIFKQQKKYLSALTMAQALALILAGAIVMGAYVSYRTKGVRVQAAAAANELSVAQNQLKEVEAEFSPRQKDPELAAAIRQTEAELEGLRKVSAILAKGEFGNTDGYAEYLRAFARQIVDGLWLTGLTISGGGEEISLEGRALHPQALPAYIQRLRTEPALQGKSFSALEMHLPQMPAIRATGEAAAPPAPPYLEFSLRANGTISENAGAQTR